MPPTLVTLSLFRAVSWWSGLIQIVASLTHVYQRLLYAVLGVSSNVLPNRHQCSPASVAGLVFLHTNQCHSRTSDRKRLWGEVTAVVVHLSMRTIRFWYSASTKDEEQGVDATSQIGAGDLLFVKTDPRSHFMAP
jgi:hypothetical protein